MRRYKISHNGKTSEMPRRNTSRYFVELDHKGVDEGGARGNYRMYIVKDNNCITLLDFYTIILHRIIVSECYEYVILVTYP